MLRGSQASTPLGWEKNICRDTLRDFNETGVPQGAFGGLFASIVERVPVLIEFPVVPPLQPDPKDADLFFFSMGSGQQNIDPFLAFMREIFWPNGQPTLEEAAFIVTWALDFTIRTAPRWIGAPNPNRRPQAARRWGLPRRNAHRSGASGASCIDRGRRRKLAIRSGIGSPSSA